MLGLPNHIRTCLFDLDGVLTPTALVHAAAWKQMFDGYLRELAERAGTPFVPFDQVVDYEKYVDGKPRADGTRSFLASRGIQLPMGEPGDPEDVATIHGLSGRKDRYFTQRLREGGVQPYPGSVRYLEAVKAAGFRRAVVSASKHCAEVLRAGGLDGYVEVRVDGVVAAAEGLAGKPAPDTFLAAARRLGVDPAKAAVFEDALAGVEAGRAGNFGYVVGVGRTGGADELRRRGADIVVDDLERLLEH
jgi:beta-phosphoglucomutase family hydrolase